MIAARWLAALLLATVASTAMADPHYEKAVMHSAALQRDMRLYVYLPPDYDPARRYPVLYFLHGKGNDEYALMNHLALGDIADDLIAAGDIKPLIIVAPQLDNSFGLNLNDNDHAPLADGQGAGRYQDYLVQDVPAWVEQHWAARTDRDSRMIGGISMGGYAALVAAFRYPERYARVGGHSAAVNPGYTGGWLYPLPTSRAERDPLLLAESPALGGLKIWLDCGKDDPLFSSNQALAGILRKQKRDVQWSTGPGGHDSRYWTDARLIEYLKFYGR